MGAAAAPGQAPSAGVAAGSRRCASRGCRTLRSTAGPAPLLLRWPAGLWCLGCSVGEAGCSPWRSRRKGRTRCCFDHPETVKCVEMVDKQLELQETKQNENRTIKPILCLRCRQKILAPCILTVVNISSFHFKGLQKE